MTRRQLKKLAVYTEKTEGIPDEDFYTLAKKLNRSSLKKFIKILKIYEQQRNVIVSLPTVPDEKLKEKLQTMYPNKKIVYNVEPLLIAGIRILDNDLLYELSFKDRLEKIIDTLEQSYD